MADRNVAADLRFIVAVRAVVLGIAADLGERTEFSSAPSASRYLMAVVMRHVSVSPAPQLELENPSVEKA